MDDFGFGDYDFDESSSKSRNAKLSAVERTLPRYSALVQNAGWFLTRDSTIAEDDKDRRESNVKKDVQGILLQRVSFKYYQCETVEDYRNCLKLALDVHAQVLEYRALSHGDCRTLEDTIVRSAIGAGDLDFAICFAEEHMSNAKDAGTKLLFLQLYSQLPNRLQDCVTSLQSYVTARGTLDYAGLQLLARALINVNPTSLMGACCLERALSSLERSIATRLNAGVEKPNEWREAQQRTEMGEMRRQLTGLLDGFVENGLLDQASAEKVMAAIGDPKEEKHSPIVVLALSMVQRLLDTGKPQGTYDTELAMLDPSQQAWLLSKLPSSGASAPNEEVEKSALEL